MHITDAVLDEVRTNGFAVVEGFLHADELAEAQNAMFEELPRPEQVFADPDQYRDFTDTPFAGIRIPPYTSWPINRLAFHPDLVNAAERFCGTTDLQLYKVELWGKYAGTVDYEQGHHRDFGNHTLVVPDELWPQLTTFTFLSDVTEDNGPTKIIPRSVGDQLPLIPRRFERGELTEHEISLTGPAGSLLLYSTDVLHRGSDLRGAGTSRFMLLADYSARGNPWMGKISWPGQASRPGWQELMEQAAVRERDLFGFPPPGSAYWTERTLREVGRRYPAMDMTPYAPA